MKKYFPFLARGKLPLRAKEGGLSAYLKKIFSIPLLSEIEEHTLAVRWCEEKDQEAAHALVLAHLRLVPKIASGYKDYGLPFMDMIAEGNIGLMQAVKNFNPYKGFRLVTYALWWIRASIQEYILRSWSLVKIASNALQKRLFFKLRSAKARIGAFDHSLTREQSTFLAEELGTTCDEIETFNTRLLGDLSLDKPVGGEAGDGGIIFQDLLPSADLGQEEMLQAKEEKANKRRLLARALRQLPKRERFILWARRLQDNAHTLEHLSEKFFISRERVRQLENQAFDKLKKLCTTQDENS